MSHPLAETAFSRKAIHLKKNCFIFIHFVKHEKNLLNGCLASVGQQEKKLDVEGVVGIIITTC